MKILLTTIVDNVNYGTYLQAFATAKVLEEMGCDVEILDYLRPHLNHSKMIRSARQNGTAQYILWGAIRSGIHPITKVLKRYFISVV